MRDARAVRGTSFFVAKMANLSEIRPVSTRHRATPVGLHHGLDMSRLRLLDSVNFSIRGLDFQS